MNVREEQLQNYQAIATITRAAFGNEAEATLIGAIRREAEGVVSLVAEEGDEVVGHIMFSKVLLLDAPDRRIAGLAPMAVSPPHQRMGIGKALIRQGLEVCKQRGYGAVVVLGHQAYYPKFGFVSSSQFGIRWEHGHDDAFMALELIPDYLHGVTGVIKYHKAFDGV